MSPSDLGLVHAGRVTAHCGPHCPADNLLMPIRTVSGATHGRNDMQGLVWVQSGGSSRDVGNEYRYNTEKIV